MSKYIELHRYGEPMLIKTESIDAVHAYTKSKYQKPSDPQAQIILGSATLDVEESYEEVKALLL